MADEQPLPVSWTFYVTMAACALFALAAWFLVR